MQNIEADFEIRIIDVSRRRQRAASEDRGAHDPADWPAARASSGRLAPPGRFPNVGTDMLAGALILGVSRFGSARCVPVLRPVCHFLRYLCEI